MHNTTVSFKISNNLKDEMINFYKDRFIEKKPPYSVFQVKDYDCVTTLYESGKVVFQGIGADIEASYWIELERIKNNRNIKAELKDKKTKTDNKKESDEKELFLNHINTIGSDEVGTGAYFGPIVVTASYVSKDKFMLLTDLGVKDSKKITDEKIIKIAPTLVKEIPHITYTLTPTDYNKFNIHNMNKTKAILHNRALYNLKNKNYDYQEIVVDEFCSPKNYYNYLNEIPYKVTNIYFTPRAENKCLSVAVSSIISRYIYLKEMKRMSQELNMPIPLGAGSDVDQTGLEIVKKYGINKLNDIAKLDFKNTNKIKELLQTK